MTDKWYCRCGQLNNKLAVKCVNCNDPASEGAATPFAEAEVSLHENPVSKRSKNLLEKPLKRVRISANKTKIVVSPRRFLKFLLLLLALSPLIMLIANPGVEKYAKITISALLLPFALSYATKHIFLSQRIIFDRLTMQCKFEKTFIFIPYAKQLFSLNDYKLVRSSQDYKKIAYEIDERKTLVKSLIIMSPSVKRDKVEWTEAASAIGLSKSSSTETLNLVAFENEKHTNKILYKASQIFPENVIANI